MVIQSPDGSFQRCDNYKKRGSGNANGHAKGPGREGQKRKRAVDEDEENEDANPPPSKRIDRNSPEPQTLRLALACPFAKADPGRNEHARCLFIRRKNLSGIKEHLKRCHFGNTLPRDIRAARSWDEVFDICNPNWHPTERPNPYFETISRKSLAGSSRSGASSVKSSQQEIFSTSAPFDCPKVHNKVEFCSPPLSSDGVSPRTRNGVIPYGAQADHRHHNVGALSPTSCSRGSNRESFSAPVEDVTADPPTTSWPIAETINRPEQRISLGSRHISGSNWSSTSVPVESNDQHTFFTNDFGLGNSDSQGNVHNPIPSLMDSSNQSFENPMTVNPAHPQYGNLFGSDLHEEAPTSWPGDNSVSRGTGAFGHAPATLAVVLNKNEGSLQSSIDISVSSIQPAPKSRFKGEISKPMNQSNPAQDRSKRKKYQLLVTRMPQNQFSQESKGTRRFTFDDFDEFHAKFHAWLRREFTDPPFSWQKMMLFNGKEEAELESVQEVADNLEQSFIQFRSCDAALYLVSRNCHLEPHRPVGLTNANFSSTEAPFHRQRQM